MSRNLKPSERDHYGNYRVQINEDDEFYCVTLNSLEDEDDVEQLSSQLSNLSSGPSQGSQQIVDEDNSEYLPWLGVLPEENSQEVTGSQTEQVSDEFASEDISHPPVLPTPSSGQSVLVAFQGLREEWAEAEVVKVSGDLFSVKFGDKNVKKVSGQEVAYNMSHKERLPVGTRCVVLCRDKEQLDMVIYKSAVVAEPPKVLNKNRYLVFFDDGSPAYVPHKDLRGVVQPSANVWEDVAECSREFIRQYLQQYPDRPMVRLSQGQTVKVECEEKWRITKVVEVDASLVLLMFDEDKRTEWLYRGSTRLDPLVHRKARMDESDQVEARGRRVHGDKTGMVIEYSREVEADQVQTEAMVSSATPGRVIAKK